MTNQTKTAKSVANASLVLMILLIVLSSAAFATNYNSTLTQKLKTTSSTSALYRTAYNTPVTSSAGWRVPQGKINLGTTSSRDLRYGDQTIAKGLQGFIRETSTVPLREQANAKYITKTSTAKYMNLVDFVKQKDKSDPYLQKKR